MSSEHNSNLKPSNGKRHVTDSKIVVILLLVLPINGVNFSVMIPMTAVNFSVMIPMTAVLTSSCLSRFRNIAS